MPPAMARGDAGTFSRRLAELKEAGSLVLVVGSDAGVRAAVSAQLLGEAGRTRIFALLGRDRSVVEERLPSGAPLDEAQVVEYEFDRSVAAGADVGEAANQPLPGLETLLDDLAGAVESAADRDGEPLSAGDLRVCLDSMAAVVDGSDRASVNAFLGGLREVVTRHAGMAHAVLPSHGVPERHEWLEPAFDVVIEARTVDGVGQERWRLPEGDLTTEWFLVDDVEVG